MLHHSSSIAFVLLKYRLVNMVVKDFSQLINISYNNFLRNQSTFNSSVFELFFTSASASKLFPFFSQVFKNIWTFLAQVIIVLKFLFRF